MAHAFRQTQRTILCIADDDAILRYEKALLERSGHLVLSACSRDQGLNFIATCQCDAVLLDYEMLGSNGHELACEIRRIRPELMLILLSGSAVPSHSLALVDALIPKLEARRQLLPTVSVLCSHSSDMHQVREMFRHRNE